MFFPSPAFLNGNNTWTGDLLMRPIFMCVLLGIAMLYHAEHVPSFSIWGLIGAGLVLVSVNVMVSTFVFEH